VVNGATSSEVHAISGVPQGSVLGPLLFLIYINNVTSLLFSPGTQITLYADVLLYKPIGKFDDYHLIQMDLISMVYLTFNPKKSKCMLVSRKRSNMSSPPPPCAL
jgi:ribonuclease P/MRP protein subunit RPP40